MSETESTTLQRLFDTVPADAVTLAIVFVDDNGAFKLAALDMPIVRKALIHVAAMLQDEPTKLGTLQ